jgi:hypothetical protein
VLAIQGAGYVAAGLAMLAWLKDPDETPAAPPVSRRSADLVDVPK